ncbi:hypothetical protein MMC25_003672 [Agyrium rufum]|nr:hypothetical protein [Agyrium rufum]
MPSFQLSRNSSLSTATTVGSDGFVSTEEESDEGEDQEELQSTIVPKIEESDDDTLIADLKVLEEWAPADVAELSPKRGRGRPRKSLVATVAESSKTAKGRSKTGCYTCRRRKKKCDEARPACMNCQKNSVICEGYPQREFWKGGKQKTDEFCRKLALRAPQHSLSNLVEGIETETDRRFLQHFVCDLSRVLTMAEQDNANPFQALLLPMAIEHKGLMHSLMALSGSHLTARDPIPENNERHLYHLDAAIRTLQDDITLAINNNNTNGRLLVDDPTVASTIVHCLICICRGSTDGDYRMHMNGARNMLPGRVSKNPDFQQFIHDFFLYHDVSHSLTSLDHRILDLDDPAPHDLPKFLIKPAIHPRAGALIGVLDGLFKFISRITLIRDDIRTRKAANLNPTVTYENLMVSVEIDVGIRNWDSQQEPNTPRWIAAQLYRQCTWVYLYRTLLASRPSDKICSAVDGGLDYLRLLPTGEPTQCILLLPLFILSCAAFEQRQRPELEKAFDNLQEYSNLGNIKPARQVVHRVWERMDAGDERSWDWEGVMHDMGFDILVT